MPDLIHVILLAANAVTLAGCAMYCRRARYHCRVAAGILAMVRCARHDAVRAAGASDPTDPTASPIEPPRVLKFPMTAVWGPRIADLDDPA